MWCVVSIIDRFKIGEVALLTLGIKKFPPGTNDRWRVVADFIGTKNQKEVIAKAKDIKE